MMYGGLIHHTQSFSILMKCEQLYLHFVPSKLKRLDIILNIFLDLKKKKNVLSI